MNARQQRALRGVAAAIVATLVSATAHTLAGGGAGSPLVLAAVVMLASPIAVALVGRRPSVPRLALAVAVSQGLFHAAFAITFPAASASAPALGHSHGTAGALIAPVHIAHHAALVPDAAMLCAHAVAAVVTVALLARGERMLRTIARGIRDLLARRVAPAPSVPVLVPRVRVLVVAPLRVDRVAFDIVRRGPPVVSLSH